MNFNIFSSLSSLSRDNDIQAVEILRGSGHSVEIKIRRIDESWHEGKDSNLEMLTGRSFSRVSSDDNARYKAEELYSAEQAPFLSFQTNLRCRRLR